MIDRAEQLLIEGIEIESALDPEMIEGMEVYTTHDDLEEQAAGVRSVDLVGIPATTAGIFESVREERSYYEQELARLQRETDRLRQEDDKRHPGAAPLGIQTKTDCRSSVYLHAGDYGDHRPCNYAGRI